MKNVFCGTFMIKFTLITALHNKLRETKTQTNCAYAYSPNNNNYT